MTQDTRLVHCYDLASFVTAIEQAVKDGYNLDLKNVEHYPQQIGFQFIATMLKQDSSLEQEVQEVKQEVVEAEKVPEPEKQEAPEVVEPEAPAPVVEVKKPGRPAKGK
jgi:MinD-like ATPase involved in chromosome partitioning or flagellar assembly